MPIDKNIKISFWNSVLALAIPVIVITMFAGYAINFQNKEKNIALKSQDQVHVIAGLREIIIDIQKIRGLEQIYFFSHGDTVKQQDIESLRRALKEKTLNKWEVLKNKLSQDKTRIDSSVSDISDRLLLMFSDAWRTQDPQVRFNDFSSIVSDIQDKIIGEYNVTLRHLEDIDVYRNKLSMLSQFTLELIESTGKLRGFGSGRIAGSDARVEYKSQWYELLGAVHVSYEKVARSVRGLSEHDAITNRDLNDYVAAIKHRLESLQKSAVSYLSKEEADIDSKMFFDTASDVIEAVVVMHEEIDRILVSIEQIKYDKASGLIEKIVGLGGIAIISLILLLVGFMRKNIQALKEVRVMHDVLSQNEYQMRMILELLPNIVFLRNLSGSMLLANNKYYEFINRLSANNAGHEEDIERGSYELDKLFIMDKKVLLDGVPIYGKQEKFITENGQSRILRYTKIPYQISGLKEKSVLTVAYDITDKYKIRELQEVASVAYWEWDFNNDRFNISDVFYDSYEISGNSISDGIEKYLSYVVDVDREKVRQAFESARLKNIPVDIEHQIMDKAGDVRTLGLKSKIYYRDIDCGAMLVGSMQDVSMEKKATQILKDSELKYRKLVENLREEYFFYSYSINGKCTYISPSIVNVLGKTPNEAMEAGLIEQCFTHLRNNDQTDRKLMDAGLGAGQYEVMIQNEGLRRYLELSEVAVKDSQGCVVGYDGIAHDITDYKLIEQDLRESEACMRALAAHLENVRESERERIAHDIHDELGGYLVALKMDISLLGKRVDKMDTQMQSRFNSMKQLLDITIEMTRRIITSLRPSILDELGLWEAIEWQLVQFGDRYSVEVTIDCDFEHSMLRFAFEDYYVAVFRIFQEILNNVAKHAHAKKVSVRAYIVSGTFVLTVADDGLGISEDELGKKGSYGILGMRERVNNMCGELLIQGQSGRGTTITVNIPVVNPELFEHERVNVQNGV